MSPFTYTISLTLSQPREVNGFPDHSFTDANQARDLTTEEADAKSEPSLIDPRRVCFTRIDLLVL